LQNLLYVVSPPVLDSYYVSVILTSEHFYIRKYSTFFHACWYLAMILIDVLFSITVFNYYFARERVHVYVCECVSVCVCACIGGQGDI